MERMTKGEIVVCREALESMPHMPIYGRRALEWLKRELAAALVQEAKYRSALSDVKATIQDVDPWDGALSP